MAEELGKIEKPTVESFKKGRKLFYVPFLFTAQELPEEYRQKIKKFWKQVREQLAELTAKLGAVNVIYHELVAAAGEEGCQAVKQMNEIGYAVIKSCREKQARMEAVEDADILTEFMDWSRCLYIGLQNPAVQTRVYEFYTEAAKKRLAYITGKIDASLKDNEIGILIMREDHQVRYPPDIQVFYIAPPALDETKRWLREREKAAAGGPEAS